MTAYGNRYECEHCGSIFRDLGYEKLECPICGSTKIKLIAKNIRLD